MPTLAQLMAAMQQALATLQQNPNDAGAMQQLQAALAQLQQYHDTFRAVMA